MSNFIIDNTSLPESKVDGPPTGLPANQEISSAEWQTTMNALKDTRTVIKTRFLDAQLNYGADPTGVTDSYAALLAFFTAIGSQGGYCHAKIPAGTYKIDQYKITGGGSANGIGDLVINGASHFTLDATGAKLDIKGNFDRAADKSGTTSYEESVIPLSLKNCSHFAIRGLEADGNVDQMTRGGSVTEGACYGVETENCNNYLLDSLNMHHFATDGWVIGTSGTLVDRNFTAINCRFWANARDAVSVAGARTGLFVGCKFERSELTNAAGTASGSYGGHAPGAGVDIEPDGALSTTLDANTGDLTFSGCYFGHNVGWELSMALPLSIDRVQCFGCTFESDFGVTQNVCAAINGSLFQGCTFLNIAGFYPSWSVSGPSSVRTVIKDCDFYVQGDTNGLIDAVAGGQQVIIEDCRFFGQHAGSVQEGIAWRASHAYIVGQRVTNSSKVYQCVQAGTSASSGGPTGTGSGITDNGCKWDYKASPLTQYMPSISNATTVLRRNTFSLQSGAYSGSGALACSSIGSVLESVGNSFVTDKVDGADFFAVSYASVQKILDTFSGAFHPSTAGSEVRMSGQPYATGLGSGIQSQPFYSNGVTAGVTISTAGGQGGYKPQMGGNVTMTATPTLQAGTWDGQLFTIHNTNGSAHNLVLQDNGTLANSKLRLSANTVTLAPGDSITLMWDSYTSMWYQVSLVHVV